MELTPEQIQALIGLAAVAPKLVALAGAPAPTAPTPAPAPAPTNDAPPAAPPAAPTAPEKKEDQVPNPEEKKTDAKAEAALIEQRVNDSLELREQARSVLGAEAVLTGKSNRDLMVEVVKHVDSKFELGNRDETYLRARFDGALVQHRELQSLQQHAALRAPRTDAKDNKPSYTSDNDWLMAKISG